MVILELFLWAGTIVGVSFIATPIKFLSRFSTRTALLEIGRLTFEVYNKFEWLMLLSLGLVSLIVQIKFLYWTLGACVLVLSLETFWLLPILAKQIKVNVEQVTKAPGWTHQVYVLLEVFKIILLISGGYRIILI